MRTFSIVALVALCLVAPLVLQTAPDKTLDKLLEQACGESKYWDNRGGPHTFWKSLNVRQYEHHLKIYAIREIGQMGPDASAAVDRLVQLCGEQSDYNTFDGRHAFHLDVVRTLALIGDISAVDPILEWFRNKAINPASDLRSGRRDTVWHNIKGADFERIAHCGPSGVVQGLTWFPPEQHEAIKSKLAAILSELEESPCSSQWAKQALKDGIRVLALDANEKHDYLYIYKSRYDFSCQYSYGIERNSFK